MNDSSMTFDAVFENGILRPLQALPLQPHQRVTVTLRACEAAAWPADVAAIYREIADEDRRLAEAMLPAVKESWPANEGQP
jgi:predicted DNA-binding antitoxin AbrB/MazE fold protein